jgi:hypothetical protein
VIGIIISNDESIDIPEASAYLDGSGDVHIKLYRDVASLEELRGFWSERQTSPAGNLDFFRSVVCSSLEFVRPHVMAIYKGGQPQSLVLGRLERRQMALRLGYQPIPSPKINIITVDDCGWLSGISSDDAELCIGNLLASLGAGEADAAELQHLDAANPLCGLATSLPGGLFTDHSPRRQVLWTRRLPESGSFLDSLSANERYNQKRRARRLSQEFGGAVRIECFHDGSRIDQLMRDAEAIAGRSYQRGLGVGFVNDDRTLGRLTLAARQGVLCAHVLYLGDRPSAFWIATLSAGVLYNDYLAFDPAWAKYSPGTYLVIKVLEEVADGRDGRHAARVDFGPGEAEWKTRLGNHKQQLTSVYIFAPNIKGAILNLLRMAVSATDRSAKSLLEKAGFLPGLKQIWRSQLGQYRGG